MESARKRKASTATPSASEAAAPKKLKLLNSSGGGESVTSKGMRLVNQLRNATDKSGHQIAEAFHELPSKDDFPDYYETIKLPIAIDMIENKLKDNAYPTMTTLESDMKRMIQNAKEYNATGSSVFEDAEKIRKLTYNFMKQNNPAYHNPSYSAFPTPIPDDNEKPLPNGSHTNGRSASATASREVSEKPAKPTLKPPSTPAVDSADQRSSRALSNTAAGEEEDGEDYTGLNFTQVHQKIMTDLISYVDADGLQIYIPFSNLPSRDLKDYYELIRHPVSLRKVLKRARGIHGRHEETGVTDFKTWEAYEDEVSFIWRNAREYNEDGSEMFELANRLEEDFKQRLARAKLQVEEPSGPKLKLAGPKPKVTLNLSKDRGSPIPAPGVGIDNAALQRQKQMVAAGVNGRQHSQQPTPGPVVNGISRATPQTTGSDAARPSTATSPPLPIKHEKTATQSPAPSAAPAVQPATNGMMPPPSVHPPSNSQFAPPPVSSYHYTAPAALPPTAIRSYPVQQSLLPILTIATHPHLKVPTPWRTTIAPHASLSQQSRTVTLPNSHYFVQISPTISRQLAMGRAYKLFVTVNGTRLSQRDTQFHVETGRRTHVYEGSLAQGVNRIEVEVAAAREGKDEEGETKKGLDVEKVTVFANLMRI